MTKTEFLRRVNRYRKANPEQRYGQAMVNVATQIPELYEVADFYCGVPSVDPFYRDENVPAFLEELNRFLKEG